MVLDAPGLPNSVNIDLHEQALRRQVMCIRGTDIILAIGTELRMLNLSNILVESGSDRFYKVKFS